jgi:para-aminobenzoate synthetase component 1
MKSTPHLATLSAGTSWVERMNTYGKEGIPFLFILDFELTQPVVIPLSEARHIFRYKVGANTHDVSGSDFFPKKINLQKTPVSFDAYQNAFDRVMAAIQMGDTYLLNLCFPTPISGIEDLEAVYDHANAPYKIIWPGKFVVFSPEQFVSISDGVIRTFPMKGTIEAGIPHAEEILMADRKEQEEHATVVDLLRNDLSIVSREVRVERYRFISEIQLEGKSLLQCSSEIRGRLPEGYQKEIGKILFALLPAGSVTGAPKKRTVEWIREIEPEPRGYYTGVFGVFDGTSLDSAVMIRMIEQRGDGFYYRSGGGITYRSEVRSEYQEMVDKVYIPFSPLKEI